MLGLQLPKGMRAHARLQRRFRQAGAVRRNRVIFGVVAGCAALAAVAPAGTQAKTRTVRCAGGANACTATVALAGLKTGDRVVIALTDTDLELAAITPSKPRVQAAYGFAGLSTRLGGSQFVARMLINPPVPKGAAVRFRFAVAPRSTDCGDDRFTIDGSEVGLVAIRATRIGCMAARRAAEGCVNGTGPGRGWGALQVDDQVILQRKGQRVAFGLGNARQSCAPSG
jgi:hypothetical protein